MLMLSMVLSSLTSNVYRGDTIDPCDPTVPCLAGSNMSDPYGNCAAYYECEPQSSLWQRRQCQHSHDNETTFYDLATGLCLVDDLKPTCHDHCPGLLPASSAS